MNTTSGVSEILTNTNNPIGNWVKTENIKPNRQLDSSVVDLLLQDYADLIEVSYTSWFAKRFYPLTFEAIHQAASQARSDGKNAKRLFAHLIKKAYVNIGGY